MYLTTCWCTAVNCGQPPAPPNMASLSYSVTFPKVYEDKIFYSCLDGVSMRGDLSSTCQEDGQWSRVRGKCSSKYCGALVLLSMKKINASGYLRFFNCDRLKNIATNKKMSTKVTIIM